jgi:hypothetical protein
MKLLKKKHFHWFSFGWPYAQIRVHCKTWAIRLPAMSCMAMVNLSCFLPSKKYKLSKHDEEERPMLNRLALHLPVKFTDAMGK